MKRNFHPEVAPECPKCGHEYGFLHSYPVYHPPKIRTELNDVPDYLEFSCGICGYSLRVPTVERA